MKRPGSLGRGRAPRDRGVIGRVHRPVIADITLLAPAKAIPDLMRIARLSLSLKSALLVRPPIAEPSLIGLLPDALGQHCVELSRAFSLAGPEANP